MSATFNDFENSIYHTSNRSDDRNEGELNSIDNENFLAHPAARMSSYHRPPNHYNPTCHVNGGGVASVLLSCCAPDLDILSGMNLDRDGDGDWEVTNHACQQNGGGRSNIWAEKARESENGEHSNAWNSNKSPESQKLRQKIGMHHLAHDSNISVTQNASPHLAPKQELRNFNDFPGKNENDVDNFRDNIFNRGGAVSSHRSKPFASTTLLERDDSLLEQASLFSSVVQGYNYHEVQATPLRTPKSNPFASTTLLERDDSLLKQSSLLSLIGSEGDAPKGEHKHFFSIGKNSTSIQDDFDEDEYSAAATQCDGENGEQRKIKAPSPPFRSITPSNFGTPPRSINSANLGTPSKSVSSLISSEFNTVDSPAMDLSHAKQEANITQSSNSRLYASEGLRRSVKDLRTLLYSKGGNSVSESITGDSVVSENNSGVRAGSLSDENSHTQQHATKIKMDEDTSIIVTPFEKSGDGANTPLWANEEIHRELSSTYRFPRLYLKDPTKLIAIYNKSGNKENTFPWWFDLATSMETTLCHPLDPHWKLLWKEHNSDKKATDSANHCTKGSDSTTRSSSPNGKANIDKDNIKSKRNNDTTTESFDFKSFINTLSPINVWTEPDASTAKVRGPSYCRDGVKIQSERAIFAVLGVDNFVNGKGGGAVDNDTSKVGPATKSYVDRWRKACRAAGLQCPPFLLVINFVVPWGNFQIYLFRPDADSGPFSSRHKDRPSEKALKSFMEGTKDYRNKRLKLIPRVCSGPWVVKKMVGSTPCLLGTKVPTSYHGSIAENYLEIVFDVTRGPAFGNTVANTVVGKANAVTVDLGFVIEGQEEDGHLPEQILGIVRLHHLDMKRAGNHAQWEEELMRSQR